MNNFKHKNSGAVAHYDEVMGFWYVSHDDHHSHEQPHTFSELHASPDWKEEIEISFSEREIMNGLSAFNITPYFADTILKYLKEKKNGQLIF